MRICSIWRQFDADKKHNKEKTNRVEKGGFGTKELGRDDLIIPLQPISITSA